VGAALTVIGPRVFNLLVKMVDSVPPEVIAVVAVQLSTTGLWPVPPENVAPSLLWTCAVQYEFPIGSVPLSALTDPTTPAKRSILRKKERVNL
jgi:hypothetical protein